MNIVLRDSRPHGHNGLLLDFAVDLGAGEQLASVLVDVDRGLVQFPHPECESGATHGATADLAVAERARQLVAVLNLFATWQAMRPRRAETRR